MVMLRKDVKVGLSIGAAVLAVAVLYFALSNVGSGDKQLAGDGKTSSSTPDSLGSGSPATRPSTLSQGGQASNVIIPVPPAVAPLKPTNITPGNADVSDPWGDAFARGTVPVSRTPGANTPATNPSSLTSFRNDIANGNGLMGVRDVTPPITNSNPPIPSSFSTTPTPATPTSAAPIEPAREHIVKTGETFSSISELYYGSANKYDIIQDANKTVTPRSLKPGTRLVIPAAPKADVSSEQFNQGSVDARTQYVIKPGDSLQKIAGELYGDATKWASVYEANKSLIGTDPARLKVGQVLKLPTPPTKR